VGANGPIPPVVGRCPECRAADVAPGRAVCEDCLHRILNRLRPVQRVPAGDKGGGDDGDGWLAVMLAGFCEGEP
jgi:hypothetical protein